MGLSLSLLLSTWNQILGHTFLGTKKVNARSMNFKKEEEEEIDSGTTQKFDDDESDKANKSSDLSKNLDSGVPKSKVQGGTVHITKPTISVPEPVVFFSPRPISELDDAATKVQKVYKSYRTRRNLADCAVVVEELWWKALDSAFLQRSSVSFFKMEKQETAVSRWARAKTRVARVGKGLSKDEKAQKLALQHWLEAIDPRHRYGHNLHFYYDIWSASKITQPFFYWLDIGDGKELNLENCPRVKLQRQCIKYLGPRERDQYEVIVESGKLVYRQNGMLLSTIEDHKWIFVLSTSRVLYVGKKEKGVFQHSSFLSGGATTAAGRLVAHDGVLEAIWPYSGHYLPTEDNFKEFITYLEEHNVDLTNVKRCAIDDDTTSFKAASEDSKLHEAATDTAATDIDVSVNDNTTNYSQQTVESNGIKVEAPVFDMSKRLSCKWTSGVGPRIGCVRDYPAELQSKALEQVNLSPRISPGHPRSCVPIPSPRPSPKIRVSPRLAYMGLPSPRVSITSAS